MDGEEALPYHPLLLKLLPRRRWRAFNRCVVVPLLRAGLPPLTGSPFTGYLMLLTTTGRRSGKRRHTPLGYAIAEGNVYCFAGYGERSEWYRNILADPHVEVLLPGGAIAGLAEPVSDPEERRRVAPHLLRSLGWGALTLGTNPVTAGDEELLAKSEWVPLVRIRPTGLGSGPFDPGGLGWLLVFAASAWLLLRLVARRRLRPAEPAARRAPRGS